MAYALLLLTLTVITHGLLLAFQQSSPAELKRRARAGSASAQLYEVSRKSEDAHMLLLLLNTVWAALLVWVLFKWLVWWLALPVSIVVLVYLTSRRYKFLQRAIAVLAKPLSPAIVLGAHTLHPFLKLLRKILGKDQVRHSGLYEKQDLLDLIQTQALQADNRISENELRIVWGALHFGDKLVRDIMVPRGEIDAVQEDDAIGPILLDELHKSGHSRFPVLTGEPEEEQVSGILYLHDLLGVKNGGKVTAYMDAKVYYVHEDFTLDLVLRAFYKTKRQLFMVVNEFEDVVGLITLEDILTEILGADTVDEFEEYENPKAVSRAKGKSKKTVSSADDDAIIIDETVVESEQL